MNGIRPGEDPYETVSLLVVAPDTPLLGSPGRRVRHIARMGRGRVLCCRPRFLITLMLVSILTLLLLPAKHRSAAHNVLTHAGVSLPDALPDRIHDFIETWANRADDGSKDLVYTPHLSPGPEDDDSTWTVTTPHEFNSNGHLIVEPVSTFGKAPPAPHPILTLIQRAEHEWNNRVQRQSKTLREAVYEYRKRYRRNPPKGFDEWWAYAKANRIVLTDEYDQIFKDLQPFWALEPHDLKHRVLVMQEREETFTIQVKDGEVFELGEQAQLKRAKDFRELIARVSKHVPNVNLTFTRHDQPACQLGWFHKERMLELAGEGEHFGPSEFIAESDLPLTNWANGCPPDSPLRKIETEVLEAAGQPADKASIQAKLRKAYATELSQKRSYIYDYSSALDICQHPEIMPLHGFTTAIGTNPGPLVPLFTFAKTNIHSDILVTPLEQYSDTYIGYDPDWEKKEYNKLMWRGSTTGAEFAVGYDWRSSQRARLHFLTNDLKGQKNVLISEEEGPIKEEMMQMHNLNKAQCDVSFSGGPVQCDDETCAIMKEEIEFRPTMGLTDSYKYKYVFDVDGNGWSGRFHRLMSMKACVFKSTLFPEWYGDRIQPWVHYVPIKVDYSDLYDALTFFRGAPDGTGAHDELGKKIGLQGKEWARDHWRKQDMAAYMFRLTLEWARIVHRADENVDPASLDFEFFD
ncbi:BQ5605_C016g08039 [Microbotryum silenes-dioicae]|uniref:BQ5605_C016g08039 protein n=1 Tax=Microbotryum silenes-dioicae TaxID=796604 RepID=A0A2X0MPW9_9BASI|nr:BQ5605_C016g08039 [Microbotryum silenes-dioicae]